MAPAEGGSSLIILDDDYHFFNLRKDLESYPADMIGRMKEKLNEIFEDQDFKFKTTILELILGHEYAFEKEYEKAMKMFDKIQLEIETLEDVGCDDSLFRKLSKALLSVIRTCKAYVSILRDDDEKARVIVAGITPSGELDQSNTAAIFGIRSMVFIEYGLYGHKLALENAEKAKKSDRENPYWHFLFGKALGRIRRVEKPYTIPSDEERNALKTAIKMGDDYLFMLFTAENYAETASKTYQFHSRKRTLYPGLKIAIDNLNEEASSLFNKCLEIQPKCSHVLFRAAKGFLNLPYPQKDPERAKELLIKGLKNNPRNPFANHLLARYYERYDSNVGKAMECLTICREQNVFGAEMDLLRLEYSKDQDAKYVIERLQHLLEEVYYETPRKLQILTQMASYYIFIENNLIKASQLLKDAMTMNCEDNIENHRSLFLRVREPFSVLEVLVDEMKIEMEKKCDPEKKRIYESFILDLNHSKFPISKGRAKNFKDEILKENEELRSTSNFQRKYVGSSRRPQRGSRGRQNTRNSYSRSGPVSTNGRKVEKAQSVQKVDDLFDSWSSDNSKNQPKRRNNNGRNSLNSSYSDLSAASDSRYSSNRGSYNNRRFSKPDNSEELQFDKLSVERQKYSSPRKENEDRKLEDEFDRLSVSSRNSDTRFNASKSSRGRGRPAYSSSRSSFQDQGDFNQVRGGNDNTKFGAGRGRPNTSQRSREIRQDNSSSQKDQTSKSPPWRRKAPLSNETRDTTAKQEDSDTDEDLMSYFKKK